MKFQNTMVHDTRIARIKNRIGNHCKILLSLISNKGINAEKSFNLIPKLV